MNERRLLVGLGLVVAVLAVVLTVIVVGGGSGPARAAGNGLLPTEATTALPTTTSPITAPSTTQAARAEPTTTVTPIIPLDLPVSGAGAVLAAPPAPDIRTEDAPNDCASLVDGGWESLDCKFTGTGPGALTYVIEALPMPSYISVRALIFREEPNGSQRLVLTAEDDSGTRYVTGELEAAVVPIATGTPVIAVGFQKDNGDVLSIDVVEQPGVVAVHEDLPDGTVTASPDGLETWAGPPRAGTAPYTHDTLKDVGGSWRIVARELVPSADVPHDRNLLA